MQVMDADYLTFPEAEFDGITRAFSFFFLSDRMPCSARFIASCALAAARRSRSGQRKLPPRSRVGGGTMTSSNIFCSLRSGSSPLNPGREMDTPEQLAARLTGAGFAEVRAPERDEGLCLYQPRGMVAGALVAVLSRGAGTLST